VFDEDLRIAMIIRGEWRSKGYRNRWQSASVDGIFYVLCILWNWTQA